MNLFKRKQNLPDEAPAMPPELNQYYQAEKRQQNVVAWLLGLATLAVTIAVAFLLFMGGRWVVQKIRKDPSQAPGTTQQESPEENTGTAPTTDTPPQTTAPQPGTNAGSDQTTQGATTPQTSSATTSLPRTGPAETVAVFMIATAVGTFAYKRSARQ